MGDKTKRQRFSTLRERARHGALTAEEQTELNGLYRHLEEMEASSLLPGIERKRHEAEKLQAINVALRDVIRRKRGTSSSDASDSCPVPHGTPGSER